MPEQIVSALHLMDDKAGSALLPVHTDLTRLQWLAEEIEKTYQEDQQYTIALEKLHTRSRWVFITSLVIAGVVIAFFGRDITRYNGLPYWALWAFGFMIALSFNGTYLRTLLERMKGNSFLTPRNHAILESLEFVSLRKIVEEEFS